jgi:hypothetical protein
LPSTDAAETTGASTGPTASGVVAWAVAFAAFRVEQDVVVDGPTPAAWSDLSAPAALVVESRPLVVTVSAPLARG